MPSTLTLRISFDKVLFALFCCYAFSMPYELILEYFFDVDTIFKPFRILSILIIGVYFLKGLTKGFYLNKNEKTDWWLYAVFGYGIIISMFRIIGGVFNMGLFLNDSFQFGLHVATFFIFKNTTFTKKQGLKIFNFFIAGIALNAFYITYQFIINFQWGRRPGFTDNPNYVAFGLVAVIVFLVLKTELKLSLTRKLGIVGLIFFMLYTFGAQGSRTGFVMLLILVILIFFFSSFRRKIGLVFVGGLIILILLPSNLERTSLTGPMVLIHRLKQTIDSGEEDVRFVVWRGIFRVLEDKGYVGMGIGQFKADFPNYFNEESNKLVLEMVNRNYYLSSHNDYLAILTDYGLPSLIFYLIFLTTTSFKLFRRLTYPFEDEEARLLAKFGFIFLVGIAIFGLGAENFQHQLYWFLLMFTTKKFL